MATNTATLPRTRDGATFSLTPALSLWKREVVRFYRNKSRVVGVIASPLLFWIVIGSGFGTSFRSDNVKGGQHYLDFFFPGALIMIVLFTAIFTMMSVIEDRKEGFLLSVMVAPVHRTAIVLGKVLGGATLAFMQGLLFLVAAPFIGVHFSVGAIPADPAGDFPGLVLADGAGLCDRLADGFDAGIPCHHQLIPDAAVDAERSTVSDQRSVQLDRLDHALEPAYVWDGRH